MRTHNLLSNRIGKCSLVILCLFTCGCGFLSPRSADIKTYMLSVPMPAEPSSIQLPCCVSVRPCRPAPAFTTKSMVYQTGPAEYEKDYYNQFLVTPAENITQQLSTWITGIGWTPCVAGTSPKDFYTITPQLEELYGDFRDSTNPHAVIKMQIALTVTDVKGDSTRTLFSKSYVQKALMAKGSVKELVTAYSKGLGKILARFQKDMEEVVRPQDQ